MALQPEIFKNKTETITMNSTAVAYPPATIALHSYAPSFYNSLPQQIPAYYNIRVSSQPLKDESSNSQMSEDSCSRDSCTPSPTNTRSRISRSQSPTNSMYHNYRRNISKENLKKYFPASQILAARLLHVSVSTLKRRYREYFQGERWPAQSIPLAERKKTIFYVLNDHELENTKQLEKKTMEHLSKIFNTSSTTQAK